MSVEKKQIKENPEQPKKPKVIKVTPHYVLLEPDPLLDQYAGKVLFPEKLARANEVLRTAGLRKF